MQQPDSAAPLLSSCSASTQQRSPAVFGPKSVKQAVLSIRIDYQAQQLSSTVPPFFPLQRSSKAAFVVCISSKAALVLLAVAHQQGGDDQETP